MFMFIYYVKNLAFVPLKKSVKKLNQSCFIKMVNRVCPKCLPGPLLSIASARNPYYNCRSIKAFIPPRKTEIFQKYLIPLTTTLCDSFPEKQNSIIRPTSVSEL